MKNHSIVLLVVLFAVFGCQEHIDRDDEMRQALLLLDRLSNAMSVQNSDSLAAIMAHDEDLVCFDDRGRFVGWEAIRAAHAARAAEFDSIHIQTRNQIITLSENCMTGWFSQEMNIRMISATGPDVRINDTRISGGMERRKGGWLIVQFHISSPVPGQSTGL